MRLRAKVAQSSENDTAGGGCTGECTQMCAVEHGSSQQSKLPACGDHYVQCQGKREAESRIGQREFGVVVLVFVGIATPVHEWSTR